MQMPSGNKVIGHLYYMHMHVEISISSKTLTEGLCGSYDNNTGNDLIHRYTRRPWMPDRYNHLIDREVARSWR